MSNILRFNALTFAKGHPVNVTAHEMMVSAHRMNLQTDPMPAQLYGAAQMYYDMVDGFKEMGIGDIFFVTVHRARGQEYHCVELDQEANLGAASNPPKKYGMGLG